MKSPNSIDWNKLLMSDNLSDDFIHNIVNWIYLSSNYKLDSNVLRKYKYYIHWWFASKNQDLDNEIIDECQDLVNWISITKYHLYDCTCLSTEDNENFIIKYKDKIDLDFVLQNFKLSDKCLRILIKVFKTNIYWYQLTKKYNKPLLSDHTILNKKEYDLYKETFASIIYWKHICKYQNLTDNFKEEYKDKLTFMV